MEIKYIDNKIIVLNSKNEKVINIEETYSTKYFINNWYFLKNYIDNPNYSDVFKLNI